MRNELTLDLLTSELQRNCGDLLASCRAVGVSLIFVSQWRKDDKKVNDALTEAERVGTQGLVSAAIQRAVHGVEEDVYYKGEVVGSKTNYSDGLLQTLLKAKVPEFAKDGESGAPQVQVNVAIMPRASNYTEWLAMKDQTMNRALPAPDADDILDAEYAEVPQAQPAFAGIDL